MVITSILDVVRRRAPLGRKRCESDASPTSEPTDSSSVADVPMAVAAYGAAVIPDE